MGRCNVRREDGKWACFSTVVDAFITPFVSEKRYEAWLRKEYGRSWRPVSGGYKMPFDETLDAICLNRTREEVIEQLKFAGINTPEVLKKIRAIRAQCYVELENDPKYLDEMEG